MSLYEINIVVRVSISEEKLKEYVTTAISNMLDNGSFITGKDEELLSLKVNHTMYNPQTGCDEIE